jgi:hypothetical protein
MGTGCCPLNARGVAISSAEWGLSAFETAFRRGGPERAGSEQCRLALPRRDSLLAIAALARSPRVSSGSRTWLARYERIERVQYDPAGGSVMHAEAGMSYL